MINNISKGQYWDKSLTLVEGCTPVSPGCDHCWSAALASRFNTFLTKDFKFTGQINIRPDRLDLPLKRKKPTAWAVWNDLFHEDVPFDFQLSVLVTMRDTPRHKYLILTKRPEVAKKFFELLYRGQFASQEPLFNVWLGTTAENQEQADKRIPILLQIPAAVRFISMEPMLGPISLRWLPQDYTIPGHYTEFDHLKKFNWVICGGESGPGARPMHPEWVRLVRNQCQDANVPFFFKQWGEYRLGRKGEDGAIYTMHQHLEKYAPVAMYKVGKKAAGRLLDGQEYLELPHAQT